MSSMPDDRPGFDRMSAKTWIVGGIMALLGTVGVLMMLLKPGVHPLWTMFFYSIPSNCAISVFPHEPMILVFARSISALSLTAVAVLGTLVAVYLDYRFFSTLLNLEVTASRYRNRPFYQKAKDWFYRAPFLTLLIAGILPIPYFPFKLLVYATKYPMWKFIAATGLGRFPRYLALSLAGRALQIPTWVIAAGFALIILGMYGRKAVRWLSRKISGKDRVHGESTLSSEGS
jgi:membrane protein YqaA with SNARE-associated domain